MNYFKKLISAVPPEKKREMEFLFLMALSFLAVLLLLNIYGIRLIRSETPAGVMPPADIAQPLPASNIKPFTNEKGEAWGPLPEGEFDFQIMASEGIWPKFIEGTIDPPDVHVGNVQKFRIVVQSPSGIQSVIAEIETDKESEIVPLEKTGVIAEKGLMPPEYGINDKGALRILTEAEIAQIVKGRESSGLGKNIARAQGGEIEVWEGQWIVRDTHEITYHTTFTATDFSGKTNSMTLAWSDACGILPGGDWTMSSNCTISGTDGVDNGNANINSGTLTLTATFAWNGGRGIYLNGGQISIGGGGALAQADLYMTDGDSDGYPADSNQYTSPGGRPRRYTLTSLSPDCADSISYRYRYVDVVEDRDQDAYHILNAMSICLGASTVINGRTYYQENPPTFTWLTSGQQLGPTDCNGLDSNLHYTTTCYPDSDGDAYTVGSAVICQGNSCSNPAGYRGSPSGAPDCADNDANTRPGQSNKFTTPGGNGFDYNCNGHSNAPADRNWTGDSMGGLYDPIFDTMSCTNEFWSSSYSCGFEIGLYASDWGTCWPQDVFRVACR